MGGAIIRIDDLLVRFLFLSLRRRDLIFTHVWLGQVCQQVCDCSLTRSLLTAFDLRKATIGCVMKIEERRGLFSIRC